MKILIVAGGTGGHILPAMALAREIKARNVGEVLFVISSRKQDRDIISGKGIDFKALNIISLQSKSLFGILKFLIKLLTLLNFISDDNSVVGVRNGQTAQLPAAGQRSHGPPLTGRLSTDIDQIL